MPLGKWTGSVMIVSIIGSGKEVGGGGGRRRGGGEERKVTTAVQTSHNN